MTIKVVFFDVDETLVDFDVAARAAHAELFGELDGYAAWCDLTPIYWPRFTSGELNFRAMREARMAAFLRHQGLDGDPMELEQRRWDAVERGCTVYDDVLDCLAALRSVGLKLGVISNNESVHQRRKLATVGLSDAFDAVVISGEVGYAKPDQAIFSHACSAIGVSSAAALHIGDLLDVDALGAAQAGLAGVWLDRHQRAVGDETVPVLTTLAQLPAVAAG